MPAPEEAGPQAGMADTCSALLQQLLAASEQEPLPLPDCWGFASAPPSLRQLLRQAGHRPDEQTPAGDGGESYVAALQASHSFRSNHSIAAMAGTYQISAFTDGLAGSLMAGRPPDSVAAQAAQQALRRTIDEAWSKEAVCRGVAHAKAGDDQAALGCYSTALELHPGNTDALVARGAALANRQQFEPAVRDFHAALALDPGNANAAKYLAVTQQHAAAAAGAAAAAAAHQRGHQHKGHQQQQSTPFSSGRQGGMASAEQQAAGEPESPRLLRHRQQQQQERDRQQRAGRSRSRSSDRSSSPGSSSGLGERGASGGRRSSHQHQQRPSVADIQQAIEVLRSAKRGSASKKKRKADGHKGSSSSKKHKHKHGSSSKGKRSSSKKHKRKKARHRHSSSSGGDSSSRSSGDGG